MGRGFLVKHRNEGLKYQEKIDATKKPRANDQREELQKMKSTESLVRHSQPFASKSTHFGRGKNLKNQREVDSLVSCYTQLRTRAEQDHDIVFMKEKKLPEEKGRMNKRWYRWQDISDEFNPHHRRNLDFWFPKYTDFKDWYLITFSPGRHKYYDTTEGINSPFSVAQDKFNGLPVPYQTIFCKFFSGYRPPPVPIQTMSDRARHRYTLSVRDYVKTHRGHIIPESNKKPLANTKQVVEKVSVYRPKHTTTINGPNGEKTLKDDVVFIPPQMVRVCLDIDFDDIISLLNTTLNSSIRRDYYYPEFIVDFDTFQLYAEEGEWYVTPAVEDCVGRVFEEDVTFWIYIPYQIPLHRSSVYHFHALNGNNGSVSNTDDHDVYRYGEIVFRIHEKRCVIVDTYDYVQNDICFERLPSFSSFGRQFDSKDIFISPVLSKFISNTLRILPDEPRNFVALMNFVKGFMEIFPPTVQIDHALLYAYRNRTLTGSSDVVAVARSVFDILSSASLIRLPKAECGPMEYVYNKRWKVVRSKGCHFLKVNKEGVITKYPGFSTNNEPKEQPMSDKYAFVLFHPSCGFQYYSRSGNNMIQGLSRYLKSRTLDDDLADTRQFNLIDNRDEFLLENAARICEASYKNRQILFREVTTGLGKHKPIHRRSVEVPSTFVGSGFMNMLEFHINKYTREYWFVRLLTYMKRCFSYEYHSVLSTLYNQWFWLYDVTLWLTGYSRLPHVKRDMRIKYVDEQINDIIGIEGCFESKVKWEAGKPGKAPRLYASIGATSLAGVLPVDLMKFFTLTEFIVARWFDDTGRCHTFKASYADASSPSESDKLYARANSILEGDYHYFFFSDDGFLVTRQNGEILRFETDIKSCDASNGFAVAYLGYWIAYKLGVHKEFEAALHISAKPTILRNRDNPSEYMILRPESYFEYSGERTTTAKNDTASVGIAYGISEQILLGEPVMHAIVKGAANYGWEVSVDVRRTMNCMTFLKRAYNGKYSWLVYGPILRSFGIVDGKPSAKHFNLTEREFKSKSQSELFQILLVNLVQGLKNEPFSPLKAAFHDRLYGVSPPCVVTVDDVCERYNLDEWELEELLIAIRNVKLGDVVVCSALNKIFHVDYGCALPLVEEHNPNNTFTGDIDGFW